MTATLERNQAREQPPGSIRPPAPAPRRARRQRPRRRIALIVALVLLVPLSATGWSYGHALTYPGSASFSVRSVDWLRSHGGGGLVNSAEVWYYSRQEPPSTGRPSAPLPPAPTAEQARLVRQAERVRQAPILTPAVAPVTAGEAAWTPGPVGRDGRIATFTTWFRPDPKHPTVVAGALWIARDATKLHLVAGTKDPGHGPWPGNGAIPTADRTRTVAAFNAGFLLRDSGGAIYQAGHPSGHLATGAASLVIDANGTATLGEWGRDVHLTADTYAVRQNLHLIVDHGRAVPGLVANGHKLWGSRKSQLQYTWRSGLGIDATGNLVYVAGNHFTLTTLAAALTQAGAVRGMQLDIHTQMVTANLFKLGSGDPRSAPRKLLPTMSRPADRYQAPDQRDFFTVTLR